jgi:hypothetical protein
MHMLLNAAVYSRSCSSAAMFSALTHTLCLLHLHVLISAGAVYKMPMVLLVVVVALLVPLLLEATELYKEVQDTKHM